jgi:hypothetical protein
VILPNDRAVCVVAVAPAQKSLSQAANRSISEQDFSFPGERKRMKQGFCKHYQGLNDRRCKAGVLYLSVARPHTQEEIDWHNKNYPELTIATSSIMRRVPCLAENDVHTCQKFELPTDAEIAAFDAEIDKQINEMVRQVHIVRPAIVADIKQHDLWKKDCAGSIPCPICDQGTINYSYAGSYNGHIHCQCTTADCVGWIE